MLRLFNIAFQSRYNLFLLISAGCMVFGLHLQIELEVGGGVHHGQAPAVEDERNLVIEDDVQASIEE